MMTIPQIVYLLCALTSLGCAILLGRAYRATRVSLLLWSTLCFSGLAISNVLLFLDLAVFPHLDLRVLRHTVTLLGLSALLHGLISEKR